MIKNSELLVILLMIPVFFQIVLPLCMFVVYGVTKLVKSLFFKHSTVEEGGLKASVHKELQPDVA